MARQETLYSLVYGSKAIIHTEMHARTTVSGSTSQEENDELMSLSLDLLDGKREAARLRNWSYQQDVARTYNNKVRTQTFRRIGVPRVPHVKSTCIKTLRATQYRETLGILAKIL